MAGCPFIFGFIKILIDCQVEKESFSQEELPYGIVPKMEQKGFFSSLLLFTFDINFRSVAEKCVDIIV